MVIFDIDLHHGTPSLCNSHPANLESLNSQATAPSRSSGRLMRSPTVKLSRLKAVHQRRRRALRYITAPSTIFSRIHVRYVLPRTECLFVPLSHLPLDKDGKVNLVQAASVSIHKSHGQYIENIHLQTYTSEAHFWDVLYKNEYSKLLDRARDFLDDTGGPGDDVLIFIRFLFPVLLKLARQD